MLLLNKAYGQNLKEKGQRTMRKSGKNLLFAGSIFIVAFITWTILIQKVDVKMLGVNGTNIGVGSIMLSVGLFCIYKATVLLCYKDN